MARMSLQAAYDQARQWLEGNDLDRAIGLAQHILAHYPRNLDALGLLGEAYFAGNQFDRARDTFERILGIDPEHIPALVGLGIIYERLGQFERAVVEFERALEIKPDMPELRSQLLRLYTEAWGSEHAQLRLSRAGLARLYMRGHMLPQAIAEFRQVIADQPQRVDTRVALAEALYRNEQESDAAEQCRNLLNDYPDLLKPNLLLGQIERASGMPNADRYWQAAQSIDPYLTIAQAMLPTLPPVTAAEPQIEEWDEADWRRRQHEEEPATPTRVNEQERRPTPAAVDYTPSQPLLAPVSVGAAANDDFLSSLLSLDLGTPPATPAVAAPVVEEIEEDLGIDMQPFSLNDLSLSGTDAPLRSPIADEPELPTMQPFSFSDLGLSEDEIAELNRVNAPAAAPDLPSAPPPAQEEDLDIGTMAPFSFADLGLSEDEIAELNRANAPAAEPSTPPPAQEEDLDIGSMAPFSFADLGLSEDEIAELNRANAPTAAPDLPPAPSAAQEEDLDIGSMAPFSFADLGLSEDEISGLDSLSSPAAPTPAAAAPQEDDLDIGSMAPFSLSDLGLSEDEISGLDSLSSPAAPTPAAAAPQEDDLDIGSMAPFSLSDLGLSEDEISGLDSLSPPAAPTPAAAAPQEEDFDIGSMPPFSLSDLGLSEDEISGLDSISPPKRGATPSAAVPSASAMPPAASLDNDDDLPSDLQPFSIDELTGGGPSLDLPPSLKPFSLEETPPRTAVPRANVSPQPGLEELLEADDAVINQSRGFSWQQPVQKQETDFSRRLQPEAPPAEDSIFTKLKVRRESEPLPPAPEPPDVTIREDEHLGLFSMDNEALHEQARTGQLTGIAASMAAARGSAAQTPPPAPAPAPEPEPDDLSGPITAANVQPFSLSELGLSDAEIAALGLTVGEPATPAPEPIAAAPEPAHTPMPEVDNLQEALASGEIQPFSFADLGLSEEELALLGMSSTPEPPAPEPVAPPMLHREPEPAHTPMPEVDNLQEALASGEIQPFSFADLGLSEEELALLGMSSTPEPPAPEPVAAAPAPHSEPEPSHTPMPEVENLQDALASGEIQPFSFADLGLSEEELAMLGLGATPEPVARIEPTVAPAAPEPFTLDDLDLETPEPPSAPALGNTLDLGLDDLEPSQFIVPPTPQPPPTPVPAVEEELEDELLPFSLADLGLEDDTGDDIEESRLGLTEEDLAGLVEGGDVDWNKVPMNAPTPEPELDLEPAFTFEDETLTFATPEETLAFADSSDDPALDRLLVIGQQQGFIDIQDIIEAVEDPETEASRIEEIGLRLHQAGIEIRDGEEVIDMEAEYAEEEQFQPAEPELIAPAAPVTDEPMLTPFSLSELGLTDEEIAMLGMSDSESQPPTSQAAAVPAEEASLAPFSLDDLLADDTPASPPAPPIPAPPAPAAEPDMTPFSLAELGLTDDEIQTITPPAVASTTPSLPTESASESFADDMTPFSLADLGLLDEPAAPAPPAPPVPLPAPAVTPVRAPEPPAPPVRETAAAPAPRRQADQELTTTVNAALDAFLNRLAKDPSNHGLRLSIARASEVAGMPDIALQQYRRLIRQSSLLDEVVADLTEMLEMTDDAHLLRQLHRALGDAYSKQGRINEAMDEYERAI